MKYLLLLISLSANADCFYDRYGNPHCIDNTYLQDLRNDANSPKIIENGQYRGNLNNNPYDPNSISNPTGQYGSEWSPDSVNNPYRQRW